MKQIIRGVLNT